MPTSLPSCPRCGYDLSGQAATWNNPDSVVCPLTGTCSECGLELEWKYAYGAGELTTWWQWESHDHRPVRALIRTFSLSLRPWRFWRAVRLEHTVRAGRLLLLAALLMVTTHLCIAVATALNSGANTRSFNWTHAEYWRFLPQAIDTEALRTGFFHPYSSRSPPPYTWWSVVPANGISLAAGLIAMLLMPVELAFLRPIMQEGRTRWPHFFRASIYSLSGVSVILAAWAFVFAFAFDDRSYHPTYEFGFVTRRDPAPWGAPFLCAWGWFWWYFAARDYLRYRRPALVAAVVSLCSTATAFGLVHLWAWRDAILAM